MTDLAYTLPLMKENVSSNESAWKNGHNQQETIHCKECDWFQPPPINALFAQMNDSPEDSVCPDVILVADCVWLSHLIAPLLQTLQAYAKKSSTKVIITYQQRGREAHEEFWKGIHDLFEDVVDVDTESSVGLAKPDVFHVMECHVMKNSDLIN